MDTHCNLLTNSGSRGIPIIILFMQVLCHTAGSDIKLITINGVNQQDGFLSNLTFILDEMMRISYSPENLSFLMNVENFEVLKDTKLKKMRENIDKSEPLLCNAFGRRHLLVDLKVCLFTRDL